MSSARRIGSSNASSAAAMLMYKVSVRAGHRRRQQQRRRDVAVGRRVVLRDHRSHAAAGLGPLGHVDRGLVEVGRRPAELRRAHVESHHEHAGRLARPAGGVKAWVPVDSRTSRYSLAGSGGDRMIARRVRVSVGDRRHHRDDGRGVRRRTGVGGDPGLHGARRVRGHRATRHDLRDVRGRRRPRWRRLRLRCARQRRRSGRRGHRLGTGDDRHGVRRRGRGPRRRCDRDRARHRWCQRRWRRRQRLRGDAR